MQVLHITILNKKEIEYKLININSLEILLNIIHKVKLHINKTLKFNLQKNNYGLEIK